MSFLKSLLDKLLALPRWMAIVAVVGVALAGGGVWFMKSRSANMLESDLPPAPPPVTQAPPVVVPHDEVLVKAQQQVVSTRSLDRKAAVESAKSIKDPAAAIKLLERLVEDPDVQVREQVVKQLGNISHPDAKKLLAKSLKDKDIYITVHAAESLARQGDFSGKNLAVNMLTGVDDRVIRMSALRTLGLSKDVTLRSAITKLMWTKDLLVQQAAKEALAAIEVGEKEVKAQERMKKENEKKRSDAKKEYDVSMNFYLKSMRDQKFPGNNAMALLITIIAKYEPAGVDVSHAKKELAGQEKVRQVHQKKKLAMTKVAPTTSMKMKSLIKSTASTVTSSPVKMKLTTVSPTSSKVKLTTTTLTHFTRRKAPVKSTLIPAKVAPTAK